MLVCQECWCVFLHSFLCSGVWDSVSDQAAAGVICSLQTPITSSHHFLDQQRHTSFWSEEVRHLLHILMIIFSLISFLLRMLFEIKWLWIQGSSTLGNSEDQHLRYLDTNCWSFFFLISYELSRELEPPIDPCPSSPNPWSHRLITKKLTSWVLF